jgi:UDP-N-acetyl-D-mannosaminuronic acid dehydrogenase
MVGQGQLSDPAGRVNTEDIAMKRNTFSRDVCVIGGGGHVGLPLALSFADCGLRTVIYDINGKVVETIRAGRMPFTEEGGPELLASALAGNNLEVECEPTLLSSCKFVVLVIGTPVDEHLNPSFAGILRAINDCAKHLRNGQILILRSTVFPGISERVQQQLNELGLDIAVTFCPERVTQGYAIEELAKYPQIISAFDEFALREVRRLFERIGCECIDMPPVEAELCKLMTNAWRYVQFATVNQFYMIATQQGLDFDRILHGCRYKYGRMEHAPGPGFAAGPCLVKDTMQLAAYSRNQFVLGHAAMLVNEGLPAHVIELAKRKIDLSQATAGILGMAFKGDSDDSRDSLSYKLRKLLTVHAKAVLCSDPYVADADLVDQERLIEESDVIFIGAPHSTYRELNLPPDKIVIDVWNCIPPPDAAEAQDIEDLDDEPLEEAA